MATETDANPFKSQTLVITPPVSGSAPSPPVTDEIRSSAFAVVVEGNSRKFEERSHLATDKFEYPRNGSEPGLILIFNQEIFDDTRIKPRRGSRRDVNEIIVCFQRQGFNVDRDHIMNDGTREEVIDKLNDIAADDLSKYNSLIVFFLTHGDECNRLHVRDATLATHEIWNPFRRCRSLDNKPKMFVFQACKGQEFSTTGNCNPLKSESTPLPTNTFSTSYLAPDMLVVYSTLEGNVSFRNPLIGSWFIQELCKNFTAYGKRDDVISLIIRTTKCVCGNYFLYKEMTYQKQMPMFVSTLSKKFYLNRNKDRSLLLRVMETNEEILKEVRELKDKVNRLIAKDEDKKKKK